MENIKKEDIEFLDTFFSSEELSDSLLRELDKKLQNPDFEKYYQKRLNEKYDVSSGRLFMDYLPMIILIALTLIGIYLILLK